MASSVRDRLIPACFLVLGAVVVLAATNIIPTDSSRFHAPRCVVALAGCCFLFTGSALLLKDHVHVAAMFVWLAGACLVVVLIWASLWTRPEEWSGGNVPTWLVSLRTGGYIAKIGSGVVGGGLGVFLCVRLFSGIRKYLGERNGNSKLGRG
jgi:hypothetical protein